MRQDKLEAAIAYLRGRKKYSVDPGCTFVPTKPVQTDVAETIRKYRMEVEQVPIMTFVRGRKK
jgi:hypothetical protein